MMRDDPRRFTILTVCSGNICRSPAAALLLDDVLGTRGVIASSAGTIARPGLPISPEFAQLLADDGVPSYRFASRPLTERLIADADLILALAREHRSRVVSLVPAALRRTYTLKEFARLASAVPATDLVDVPRTARERLLNLTALAARFRTPVPRGADDVEDPFGRSLADYRTAYAEIHEAVATIAELAQG